MKIAKVLKKISKLKGEISDLAERIEESNSCLKTNEFAEDVGILISSYRDKVAILISLKERVMRTNIENGMYNNILLLAEKKAEIKMLKDMGIKSGHQVSHGYKEEVHEYKCQVGLQERNKIVAELETEVEDIIDTLDEFNATTEI